MTGPTGSGKSTTLYACLSHLRRPEIRILTAEDPVEYVYDDMSQTEVNADIGNTFAAFLRAFLRHDPEVIMVGEIRDEETAEMAFRAAQTGHLLLSTLHTNSALAALPRLLDLGVDPSLVASSLIGVISQRLARQVCTDCRQTGQRRRTSSLREFFGDTTPDVQLFKGAGCAALPPHRLPRPDARRRSVAARRARPPAHHEQGAVRGAAPELAAHHHQHGPGRARAAGRRTDDARRTGARPAVHLDPGTSRHAPKSGDVEADMVKLSLDWHGDMKFVEQRGQPRDRAAQLDARRRVAAAGAGLRRDGLHGHGRRARGAEEPARC